ncbi:MAG: hypothetical protein PHT33_07295 [bacterium]|nr:hypothetical protein [bacterium]
MAVREMDLNQGMRAASWWSELSDLQWPSPMVDEKINRRADALTAAGVNMAIQYGFHFRWDYLPVMERLHGYLRQVRESLGERGIIFADHHSSVLVHRVRSIEDRAEIQRRNAHHVPFYPDADYADGLRFNGSLLNDWMMISTRDGKAHYNKDYNNRQFCMNNPDFRQAYRDYLARLIVDTGIRVLMSDDAIFYAGWEVCDCRHCREKFRREYGAEQPADLWRLNKAPGLLQESGLYRDVVLFRLRTVEEFIAMVKETVGPDVALATCCSVHNAALGATGIGMSAESFARHCDFLMQEICSPEDRLLRWTEVACDGALFEGLASSESIPYLPLAYAHCRDLAGLAWGVSRFWSNNLWLSTQKGRLAGSPADIDALPEEADLWEDIAVWEKSHKELFTGRPFTRLALYYNVPSRDFGFDTCDISRRVCRELVEADTQFRIVSSAELLEERIEEDIDVLLLLNTECLSQVERAAITAFAAVDGKQVVVLGRAGIRDETGKPLPEGAEDIESRAILLDHEAGLGEYLEYLPSSEVKVTIPDGHWRWRVKRTHDSWIVIFLATGATAEHHESIRNAMTKSPVIRKLSYKEAFPGAALSLEFSCSITGAELHSPDIEEDRSGILNGGNRVSFDLAGLKSFFVIQAGLKNPG